MDHCVSVCETLQLPIIIDVLQVFQGQASQCVKHYNFL